ncbi:hypothetical protein JMJ76_0004994 [Colletotrichum scovillei]|nr:hypothetical protein JMJ76_0004994 [Colletotrichum scovillei]
MKDGSQYQSHVGNHQRKVALIILLGDESRLKMRVKPQRRRVKSEWIREQKKRRARDESRQRQAREAREAAEEKCGERRDGESQQDYEKRMKNRWQILWQGRGMVTGYQFARSISEASEGQEGKATRGEGEGQVSPQHPSDSSTSPPLERKWDRSSRDGGNRR